MDNILVTGSAGFIGFHLSRLLLETGYRVIGLDSFNSYYDLALKKSRSRILSEYGNFKEYRSDIATRKEIGSIFDDERIDCVVNLAAQAGVRYSLEYPEEYSRSNMVGFLNLLEECRFHHVRHFIYASTSSVYGANRCQPYSTSQVAEHPLSLYAASKKSNELMAHSYSHLFQLPTTGLRFFTVYGPWGRPDMAYFKFTKAILGKQPIEVYNQGEMWRDFTYVSDIVESIKRLIPIIPKGSSLFDPNNPNPSISSAPYKIYNIGNSRPVKLLDMIEILEDKLGMKAQKNMMDMQLGDVPSTYADVEDLVQVTGFRPQTSLEDGISSFVDWYLTYYRPQDE
ncbi:NAD-dependent epimerase/dehydratase family protein [Pseudobacteriovorax antillogorgiicola]|uniref:UDP-glucuronate 4-epimerase n=1 Tax=Pseudobacteriovorax antillogorgiicola TaxID=1513793 RepID=A0A1Y6CJN7_9BACT|nr:NAD-dependent epimerase/dehydratase family protein [Pseudobacteriovorax antillogorgiicola]TCS46744.1 UDP-glucuronate 4-epimerase [Pseudobacteriovorax antillogorgiicola]SMF67530.1 UDP-glucuronate 4-epimerase [Pseudobacteriovorax antillogorgiicola]